jgi:hypothetical protein
VLLKPRSALLASKLEDRIIVLLPELESTIVDFVNGFPKLRAHSNNATCVFHICTLPLRITDSNNEILE